MMNSRCSQTEVPTASLRNMIALSGFRWNCDADGAPSPFGGPRSGGNQGHDDVVAKETSHPTTTTNQNSSLEEPVNHQRQTRIYRNDLKLNDVVLGRSNERGLYAATLKNWWPRYECASHSGKRIVCRALIRELHQKGIRFLNKEEDGTRYGYYTIEPPVSVRVERKVLRGLRQEVLKHEMHKAFLPPCYTTSNPVFKDSKNESKCKPQVKRSKGAGSKKTRPTKVIKARKVPRIKHSKPKNETSSRRSEDVNKYLPILPAPSRNHPMSLPIILVPPPPPQRATTPPILRMASSSELTANHPSSSMQLIPSALNWGTSDLTGAPATTKPHAATSPDTVILPEEAATKTPKLQLRSSVSYDLTKIFDDVIDPMNEDTGETTHPKECPPILSGRQSSNFSMVQFTDWQHELGSDDYAKNIFKPSTSTMNRRLSLIDDDVPPSTAAVKLFATSNQEDPMVPSTPRFYDHFDRTSIFGGDEAAALISPTFIPPSFGCKTVSAPKTIDMPHITPSDEERCRRRSSSMSMDMMIIGDNLHHPIPMPQQVHQRTITDNENEEYRKLCNRLEVSMAKLESEELEHRSWEAHNEALWRHFIQEQPDLAKFLNTRNRDTNPVNLQGQFSQETSISNFLRDEHPNMENWKWSTPLYGGDMEEVWEAV